MNRFSYVILVGFALLIGTAPVLGQTDFGLNVTDYGTGIPSTTASDNVDAIQDAIDAAETNGGGLVLIPAGVYEIDQAIQLASGVAIRGEGCGATVIQMETGVGTNILAGNNVDDVSISDLSIVGSMVAPGTQCGTSFNDVGQSGISLGDASNIRIQNVCISETRGYGIGLQVDGSNVSDFQQIYVSNVRIENAGDDGIDIKNKGDTNSSLMFDNITIINPGYGESSAKAGIDVRGPATLSNIHVEVECDHNGVSFRHGEETDAIENPNGVGGHESSLTNFHISSTDTDTNSVGVTVKARNVSISNGTVKNLRNGISITDTGETGEEQGVKISNVSAVGTSTATNSSGFRIKSGVTGTRLVNCSANDGATGFVIEGERTILTACSAMNNSNDGVSIDSGATDTLILGGYYLSNTVENIDDDAASGETVKDNVLE